MTNAAEKLASEIERVSAIRQEYMSMRGRPQVNVEPAIAMMTAAIDQGIAAASSNDALRVMAALRELKGFTE